MCNSRHVKRNKEFEAGAGILGSLVRVRDLIRFPAVGSNVEGECVNAVIVGKVDVVQPSILGVGEGVSHHMVGSHELLAATPLRNYAEWIAERSGKWKVGAGRNNSEIKSLPGDRGMGAASAKRAIARAKMNLTKAIMVFGLEES